LRPALGCWHAGQVRIAYLADPISGNGFYRGIGPMTALRHVQGHAVQRLFTDEARPLEADISDIDVLYVHRYCNEHAQQLVSRAKAAGAAVVWDNDDDQAAMPRSSASYRHFGGIEGERRLGRMRRIFRVADLVTSPSTHLSERMLSWGARRTATIENHVAPQFLGAPRRPHSGVRIGWVAGLEHTSDANALAIRSTLERLLDEYAELSVTSIGLGLGLPSDRYEHIPSAPLMALPQHIAGFDIAVAPIADSGFNRSRSNIKLKEYAAAGVPWLASPIGPYAAMGEKQGGRLVADDGWYDALKQLIEKPRERRKLAKRAERWVKGETLSANAHLWEARFDEAIALARAAA
jgi:glycosyltransferase involved in cell wall biosynthesis